jgi:transcriptional regulator with XRE-family HTH domain
MIGLTALQFIPILVCHLEGARGALKKRRIPMTHLAEAASATLSRRSSKAPSAIQIDRHVGERLRERRVMLGITQQRMAELLGLTYQQTHKYEKGINRISAGRLLQIAAVLGVEVDYFFAGLDQVKEQHKMKSKRLFLELSRTMLSIQKEEHREAVLTLARSLAEPESADSKLPRCGGILRDVDEPANLNAGGDEGSRSAPE